MGMSTKIQSSHQQRRACVYVRQSTLQQVMEHQESSERQYQLRERALALGWAPTQVEVIDEDQGRSGTSALHRGGFQHLVSEISLGKVGLVLMLEASRLARNNSDWHRLIELCGLSCTLIADENAVYDARDPNDRLLLGVKGTLSEAELFTLRTRLYEGRWNKARKGLLAFLLPVGYVRADDGSWEAFVSNKEQLQQNWYRQGRRGAPREGRALLQGIVHCGVCGQKMSVLHQASRAKRAPSYICQRGYREGEAHICQSMSSRPVDAAVVQAFLEAVSPLGVEVALQVLDKVEQELADKQRQWQLQLEQARYEARLAERRYQAVDPDNRLVASELERRWEEKLVRVAQLEHAYAEAEADARWQLTTEERADIMRLSQDLPAIWQAETTSQAERKQLLRLLIESVQLDGVSRTGQIEVQIHWRSGTVTRLWVKRPAPGEGSLKTPPGAVALIHQLAAEHSYDEIAEALNTAGYRTAFGRPFNRDHVGYICRRDGLGRGKAHER
jgi:DNA invertase Pin-like site-specific DNA recombinase